MERTVRNLALSLAVAALCWLGAVAQTGSINKTSSSRKAENSGKLTASESHFVRKAAESNLAEIDLRKLAAERASSQDVKQFGQRMVDDHTKADDQLKQVASEEGVTLPNNWTQKMPPQRSAWRSFQANSSITPTCWIWFGITRRM
jgi:putative membrane protein